MPIRLTQNVFSTSGVSLCGTKGSPCSLAAVLILASDASTQAATSGCSTSVSVEITCTVFVRSAAGSSRIASQTSCNAALESLPPL